MYDSVMQLTTEATIKSKQEMEEQLLDIKKQQTRLARDRAEVDLAKKHPDFKEIRESGDFHDWALYRTIQYNHGFMIIQTIQMLLLVQ